MPVSPGHWRPHHRRLTAAALWLTLATAAAHAQNGTQIPEALLAADPMQPVPPAATVELPAPPTPPGPQPSGERRAALAIWQQANARVAEFPRGHIDILRWEASQGITGASGQTPTSAAAPLASLLAQALRLRPELIDEPGLSVLEEAQRRNALADVVREVQVAWLQAVAARARLQRAADVLENTRTGAELGRRMVTAGNWSRMRQLQEQQTETAARQAWLAARLAEQVAIETLARSLGLWQADQIAALRRQLPDDLPAPPPLAPTPPADGVEGAALKARASLQGDRARAARLPADARTQAWETAHAQAVVPALDGAGPVALPSIADPQRLNDHRSAHATQARAQLLTQASRLRSQAREAWLALQTHHVLAGLAQDEALKYQEALEQEVLQRYNGMFVSTWDLLAAARDRLSTLDLVTDARLAYWQAEADWRALLAGGRYAGAQGAPMAAGAAAESPAGH